MTFFLDASKWILGERQSAFDVVLVASIDSRLIQAAGFSANY